VRANWFVIVSVVTSEHHQWRPASGLAEKNLLESRERWHHIRGTHIDEQSRERVRKIIFRRGVRISCGIRQQPRHGLSMVWMQRSFVSGTSTPVRPRSMLILIGREQRNWQNSSV